MYTPGASIDVKLVGHPPVHRQHQTYPRTHKKVEIIIICQTHLIDVESAIIGGKPFDDVNPHEEICKVVVAEMTVSDKLGQTDSGAFSIIAFQRFPFEWWKFVLSRFDSRAVLDIIYAESDLQSGIGIGADDRKYHAAVKSCCKSAGLQYIIDEFAFTVYDVTGGGPQLPHQRIWIFDVVTEEVVEIGADQYVRTRLVCVRKSHRGIRAVKLSHIAEWLQSPALKLEQ